MMRLAVCLLLPLSACLVNLDFVQYNPRHCSTLTAVDCEDKDEEIDKICAKCEDDYNFTEVGLTGEVTRLELNLDPDPATGEAVVNDAYFITGSGGDLADVTIMFSQGNYGGIEHYLHLVENIYPSGANLFIWEYRGYGKSSTQSTPNETLFMADSMAAYNLLITELNSRNLPNDQVVHFGMSLGAIAAIEIARQHPGKGLILQSSFPGLRLFAEDSTGTGLPVSFLASGGYDNYAKMPELTSPVLFIHGEADTFIRIAHSERLQSQLSEGVDHCLWRIAGAKHGVSDGPNAVAGKETFSSTIKDWILEPTVCPENITEP
ncbi:MAG: alpha/beta hydrolase [Myxococcota bacterium]|nr:alpha/beta hydrolase [Myxococcota bacterium]